MVEKGLKMKINDIWISMLNIFLLVLLDSPDTVLIERVMGKRIDPITGGKFFHLFFGTT